MQITVTVYATRDEIRDWLAYQVGRHGLHFALVRYWPEFEVAPISTWGEFDQHKDAEHWREVWIDLHPIRDRCKGQMDCVCQNPDRLALQLPDEWRDGLRPGVLGTLSEDETRLKVWKQIIRFFRTNTRTGIWLVNDDRTARRSSKHLRYSPGVEILHRNGLKLRPFAGEYEVFIDPPAITEPDAAADGGA